MKQPRTGPVNTGRPGADGGAPESLSVAVGLNIDDSVQGGLNKVTIVAYTGEDGTPHLQVLGEGMEASKAGAEVVIQMLVMAAESLSGELVKQQAPEPKPKRPAFNPKPRGAQ